MIVELHNKLGSPLRVEATRILIRDPVGGVLALAVEVGPQHYHILHRGDGDEAMNRALRSMGINETVISESVTMPRPPGTLWQP